MKNVISKSALKAALHKTDVLSSAFLQDDWTEVKSCSFDRIVGVKHTVVLRLKGEFTHEGWCYIVLS